jgi:hypothetical protein
VNFFLQLLEAIRETNPHPLTSAHREEGNGFFFQPLKRISESNTKLNFVFEMLFFCSAESAKKILNYKAKN